MTDSVAVFPAGYRLTDSSTGAPLSGAVIYFYDAGTTTPKTVYSDKNLSSSLGSSVTTDALGYPTSDGISKTLIYVGTTSYKVVIKNSAGSTIAEHDNVKGAVETTDPGSLSVTSTKPVETKSLNYTVASGDQNKIFAGNCTGGDVTFTLPSAVTVGTGWGVTIQHAGSANQVLVSSVSSQTISNGFTSFGTVLALSLSGEEVTVVSDGGNWRCTSYVSPNIKRAQGILTVTARLTAPPGSEVQGDLYLISGSPTGAWSSFAQHDIVQYTNSAWVKFTPPTDSGWVAFVKNENKYYRFIDSAWVSESATDTVAGTIETATQAEMEAATSTTVAVTPAVAKNHPGVAKFWAFVSVSGTTPTLAASYNVTSVTRNNTGLYTVTIDTDFSSANYCVVAMPVNNGSNNRTVSMQSTTQAAGSFQVRIEDAGFTTTDISFYVVGFGDQ